MRDFLFNFPYLDEGLCMHTLSILYEFLGLFFACCTDYEQLLIENFGWKEEGSRIKVDYL
jgi:hypothetical protein